MSVRKKIDISVVQNAQLTSEGNDSDLAFLKANGPRVLPNSPTASKWDAESIKRQFYKQPEILFAWLKAIGDALETLGINIDDYLDTNDGLVVHLAGSETITGEKSFSGATSFNGVVSFADDAVFDDIAEFNGTVWFTEQVTFQSTIKKAFTDYVYTLPNKTGTFALIEDVESYHRFRTDASGFIYQIFADGADDSNSDNRVMNHNDGVGIISEVQQLKEAIVAMLGIKSDEKQLIEKLINGQLTVGHANIAVRALTDSEGHAIDVTQYGNSVALSYEQSTGKLTVKLYNKLGTQIDSKVIDLPSELVFTNQYYDSTNKKLVFVPASGGSNIEISLSDLVDTYTAGTDSDGICTVSINDHVIKVTVADGSISMAKLSSTLQSTWNGWVSAEADRVLAEQGRASAEAQRVLNENARLAMPHLDIDNENYLIINYGSSRDITID